MDRIIGVFDSKNIGVKLSPVGRFNGMFDENPVETYTYLITQLNQRKIGFIEAMEPYELVNSTGDMIPGRD